MNGEVRFIYVLAGGSKCSVVIADWLVCIADVSGLGFDGDVFLAVEFSSLFFFSLFFCSIDHGDVYSLFYITTDSNCLFAEAIACISKCVCK